MVERGRGEWCGGGLFLSFLGSTRANSLWFSCAFHGLPDLAESFYAFIFQKTFKIKTFCASIKLNIFQRGFDYIVSYGDRYPLLFDR